MENTILHKTKELPIARYKFEFTVENIITLPNYSGSTLRGIFGIALRELSCMTKSSTCNNCPLQLNCAYHEIFETSVPQEISFKKIQNVPHGYIIEAPPISQTTFNKGSTLSFNMVLFGLNINRLMLIAFAWKQALIKGVGKGNATLTNIYVQNKDSWLPILNNQLIQAHNNCLYIEQQYPKTLSIKFDTPLRLQNNGKPVLVKEINHETFFLQLLRRLSLLNEVHFGNILTVDYTKIKEQISQIESNHDLFWHDWSRYSNRQKQKMNLGGVMGTWSFKHLPEEFSFLLYIGQWTHAGKNTTFGLGQYSIIS